MSRANLMKVVMRYKKARDEDSSDKWFWQVKAGLQRFADGR